MLVFYTPDNRAGVNKKTGRAWHDGDWFAAEAKAMCKAYPDSEPIPLRGSRVDRFKTYASACADRAGMDLDAVAFFTHGTRRGLVHLCRKSDLPAFAGGLSLCCAEDATIILNACLAGNEMSQNLADELAADNLPHVRVWGHLTAGDTSSNPRCVVSTASAGTRRIVPKKSKHFGAWDMWLDPWHVVRDGEIVKAFNSKRKATKWSKGKGDVVYNDNRFRAPFMDQDDIERAIGMPEPQMLPPDWRCPDREPPRP